MNAIHLLLGRQLALNQGVSRQRSLELGIGISLIQDTIPAVLVAQTAARREAPLPIPPAIAPSKLMPVVVALKQGEALDLLKARKIAFTEKSISSDVYQLGIVADQVPKSGQPIGDGEAVISISSGPSGTKAIGGSGSSK